MEVQTVASPVRDPMLLGQAGVFSFSRSCCTGDGLPCLHLVTLGRASKKLEKIFRTLVGVAALKRVGGSDVFAEPVVVQVVDPINQDETWLGEVVG